MRIKLHNLIFVGMALGVVAGLILHYTRDGAARTAVRINAVFDAPAAASGVVELRDGSEVLDLTFPSMGKGVETALKSGRNEIGLEAALTTRDLERARALIAAATTQPSEHNLKLVFVGAPASPLRAGNVSITVVSEPATGVVETCENVLWWLDLFGPTIFMGALKMIIAPLILASIVAGVTSLPNMKELGSIGWKTMVYYIGTTTIAVVIGLVFVLVIQPGSRPASRAITERRLAQQQDLRTEYAQMIDKEQLDEDDLHSGGYLTFLARQKGAEEAGGHEAERYGKLTGAEGRDARDILRDDLIKPLLMNPFESLTTRNSLGIIFFALLLGVACTVVGERARPVVGFFHGLNDVIMKVTHWLMAVSPFAIGCIMAKLVADNGPEIFAALGWYCGTVIGAIVVHVGVLLAIAATIGGVGPLRLWKGIREAWMIAFTTRSSAATLPVTIANTTERLNVSPKVANFTLPLGATMNMDGTALYEGVAVIFLIQMFGVLDDVPIEMTAAVTFMVFITAVLASVGAAAVPDAGLVTMVLVAMAVHLPVYYIPIIFAVDAFLDMFRTSTNVLGDAIGAIVVNRLERGRLGEAAA